MHGQQNVKIIPVVSSDQPEKRLSFSPFQVKTEAYSSSEILNVFGLWRTVLLRISGTNDLHTLLLVSDAIWDIPIWSMNVNGISKLRSRSRSWGRNLNQRPPECVGMLRTQSRHSVLFLYTETWQKKGKSVPLEAWSGPEGSRKLRFPDYMTVAQDDGKGKGKAVPL